MVQSLKISGLGKASGVAAVLIIAGLALYYFTAFKGLGELALVGGVLLLIVYGVLGVFGIIKRLVR